MFKRTLSPFVPPLSFFLFGPRQVGKSTLLKDIPSILFIDLLSPEEQLAFSKKPSLLTERLDALNHEGTIIVDEIQRVPKLLDVIHLLMEKKDKLRFIMSGSSARKLRHGASNLLGGRAIYKTLHPLTFEEMGDTFRLNTVLSFGSLPKIWTLINEKKIELAQDLLRSYVTTYINEEIKSEALVRNLQGFQNFLDVAAAQFAEQVNLSGISRDCQVAYTTVREYYAILEDTLMGFFLPPYIKSVRKRMSHQPKFYFFDNGVTRAMLGSVNEAASPIETGRLFEQWFIQEVYRLNTYYSKDWKMYFWRTGHGAEVDLLLEKGGKIEYAIECKYKQQASRSDLSGLRAFCEGRKKVKTYLVMPVSYKLKIDSVNVVSPVEMLDILKNA